ncbi:serine protease snake-like [Trichoplusia ni]|uniref:Serine protease snake-like n=1 Tax=Trichoplusia ni TaxID=7111 RepID=A0A7E5WTN5_TRINI|nr:serine protease snake-like [Trichoplusia ni]
MLFFMFFCVFLAVSVDCRVVPGLNLDYFSEYGSNCVNYLIAEPGVCLKYEECETVKVDEKFNIKPQICPTNETLGLNLVCCHEKPIHAKIDYSLLDNYTDVDICFISQPIYREPKEPIPRGKRAWEMCLEYQEVSIKARQLHELKVLAGVGGVNARLREFPHMVLLGYGKNFSKAEFNCGGSVISDRYVLTAAHCRYSPGVGFVTFAVIGILDRYETPAEQDIYGVKKIIKHPMYKPPKKYHDIALLEMDRRVIFDIHVMPACLHVGDPVDDSEAYATGWGYLGQAKELATVLQKIPLWQVSNDTCIQKFSPYRRHLPNGIDDASQMCYGDDGEPRDTCEGDSGGPLQIMSKKIYCMYVILGVTSFGITACGEIGYPGVYTRVSNYVPWIESIVWP